MIESFNKPFKKEGGVTLEDHSDEKPPYYILTIDGETRKYTEDQMAAICSVMLHFTAEKI